MRKENITLSSYRFASIDHIAQMAGYSRSYTRSILYYLYHQGKTWIAGKSLNALKEKGWYHSLNDLGIPYQENVKEELGSEYIEPFVDESGYLDNYDVLTSLSGLELSLKEVGYSFDAGESVKAAQKVLAG